MKITVIGAGNSGLAMAAYLSYQGHCINLWNRSLCNIKDIQDTNKIYIEGIIQGDPQINLATNDIKKAINDCNLIFVTTPANSHKDIATQLAPYLNHNHTVILHPGRTFGILEFLQTLEENGCTSPPQIAETQTIVFTCRKISTNSVHIFNLKKDVLISSLFNDSDKIISKLPSCLQNYYKAVSSFFTTSFGNVGMILHVLPVLLNAGWIECEDINFKYYYAGITPTISLLLEKLDNERLTVAQAYGVNLESLKEWLCRSYQIEGKNLYDCIHNVESYKYIDAPKSLNHRYLYEDIPTGLVPLEAAGKIRNVQTPLTTHIIDLANHLLEYDFRENGRNISTLNYLKNKDL